MDVRVAKVKRAGDDLVIVGSDGMSDSEMSIPPDLMRRSQLLTQTYSNLKQDEQVEIGLSSDRLTSWLKFVRGDKYKRSSYQATELEPILKVSDYLNDQLSIDVASALLASHLTATTELNDIFDEDAPPARSFSILCSAEFGAVVEVLQRVPEHLALAALRAVFTSAPPSIIQSIPDVPQVYGLDDPDTQLLHRYISTPPAAAALGALLFYLPTPLRPIALTAACPTLHTDASLSLIMPSSPTAYSAILAASQLSHVSSVTLLGCEYTLNSRNPDQDPMAALPALPSLASLTVKYCMPRPALNCFPALICALPRLTRLTRLSLRRTRPGEACFYSLCRQFATLPQLQELDMGEMGLGETLSVMDDGALANKFVVEEHAGPLAAGLAHLTALHSLVLESNVLGNAGWQILAPAVLQLPLRSLNLSHCGISSWPQLPDSDGPPPPAVTSLERLIFKDGAVRDFNYAIGSKLQLQLFPRLRELHLKMLLPDDADACFGALRDATCSLQVFDVHVAEALKVSRSAAQAIVACLAKWTGLRWLHLGVNDEDRMLVPGVVEPLGRLTALEKLCLRQICFEDYAPAVSCLTGLTCLHLNSLFIRVFPPFVDSLSATLRQLSLLEELQIDTFLAANYEAMSVEDKVAAHSRIAHAIKSLTSLTKLVLARMDLVEAFASTYHNALECLTGLKVLRIAGYRLGPAGMAILAPALLSMVQLQTLDLRCTGFGLPGAQALAQVLPRMKCLRDVDVGFCGKKVFCAALSDKAVAVIRAALPPGVLRVSFRYDKEVHGNVLLRGWMFE